MDARTYECIMEANKIVARILGKPLPDSDEFPLKDDKQVDKKKEPSSSYSNR